MYVLKVHDVQVEHLATCAGIRFVSQSSTHSTTKQRRKRRKREEEEERGAEFLLSQNSQTTINQMLFGTSLMACRNDMSGVGACKHIEKKENEQVRFA